MGPRIFAILEVIAVIFAFAAAWFWFRSSQSFDTKVTLDGITSARQWLENVAQFNRYATLCAAVSALCQGLTIVAVRLGL
jgi:hypothetical protein